MKSGMTEKRIKINFAAVNVSFLFNMSAYYCLEGLQSSLNKEAGTQSLSALYSALVIMSLFLPTLAMGFLSKRAAMGLATLTYPVYTIANCYAKPYTLIPSAVLLGCGSSVLWAASRVYISDLASIYACKKNLDIENVTTHFFGIFMTLVALSLLSGNVISSIVLNAASNVGLQELSLTNSSHRNFITTSSPNAFSTAGTSHPKCGIHDCDNMNAIEISTNDTTSVGEDIHLETTVLYWLFGSFAATQVIAALIMFFILTETPNQLMANNNNNMELNSQPKIYRQDGEDDVTDTKSDSQTSSTLRNIIKQVAATTKYFFVNLSAKLLIPITVHIGFIQGFALGQFTRHWIACFVGIHYIGYGVCAFGTGSIIGSYGAGSLTRFIHRWIIIAFIVVLEFAVCLLLLFWEPNGEGDVWTLFMIFGIIGLVHSANKTILTAVYSLFFPSEKEPANASLCLLDSLGSAIAYAISGQICNNTFIITTLSLAAVGTALYLATEKIYATERKKGSEIENSNNTNRPKYVAVKLEP